MEKEQKKNTSFSYRCRYASRHPHLTFWGHMRPWAPFTYSFHRDVTSVPKLETRKAKWKFYQSLRKPGEGARREQLGLNWFWVHLTFVLSQSLLCLCPDSVLSPSSFFLHLFIYIYTVVKFGTLFYPHQYFFITTRSSLKQQGMKKPRGMAGRALDCLSESLQLDQGHCWQPGAPESDTWSQPHSFLLGRFEKTTPAGAPAPTRGFLPSPPPPSLGFSIPKSRQHQSPGGAGRIPEVTHIKHPAQGWPATSELISDHEEAMGKKSRQRENGEGCDNLTQSIWKQEGRKMYEKGGSFEQSSNYHWGNAKLRQTAEGWTAPQY